ncbi:MAG: HK97 family phage prohead protease [Sphingomonadales bacterium]|nr:MAG: HK97 family phage prohead protease [Sphingomonadales bacterium]
MSSIAETGLRFAGYAALFDLPDGIRDIIRKGAFAKTLRERAVPLPLFWQHNPDQQIGTVEHIAEDRRGLRVIARIDNPTGRAAKALRSRMADGLSFGFRARRFRRADGARELDEVDLFEVSLVTHPLQHHARVHLIA